MKKTLSIVLTLAMLIGMLPMMASAADVGSKAELEAATGEVTLTANITGPVVIANDNVVINGNGFKITATGAETAITINANNVTLNNVSAESEHGIALVVNADKADPTIVGGTYKTCTATGGYVEDYAKQGEGAMRFNGNNGTVTVKDTATTGGIHVFNATAYEITGNNVSFDYAGATAFVGILVYSDNSFTGAEEAAKNLAMTNTIEKVNDASLLVELNEGWTTSTKVTEQPVAPVYGGPVMNQNKIGTGQNGYVKTSPIAASEGATITIYSFANEGFELASVTVLDKNGEALELTQNSAGRWTYKIPAGGVTVTPVFAAK